MLNDYGNSKSMYLVSKSDISTMIIPNTVGEQKKFKILFEHFNNDDSIVVTDFVHVYMIFEILESHWLILPIFGVK